MKNSGIILGSFVADSLALGPHWIYDTAKIDKEFGRIGELQQPLTDSYHKTKNLGDFTHYGDQTLYLLQSLVESNGFELQSFSSNWQGEMAKYKGYMDGATKQTLENLHAGKADDVCGSPSADLGGGRTDCPSGLPVSEQSGKYVGCCTITDQIHPQQCDGTHRRGTTGQDLLGDYARG